MKTWIKNAVAIELFGISDYYDPVLFELYTPVPPLEQHWT